MGVSDIVWPSVDPLTSVFARTISHFSRNPTMSSCAPSWSFCIPLPHNCSMGLSYSKHVPLVSVPCKTADRREGVHKRLRGDGDESIYEDFPIRIFGTQDRVKRRCYRSSSDTKATLVNIFEDVGRIGSVINTSKRFQIVSSPRLLTLPPPLLRRRKPLHGHLVRDPRKAHLLRNNLLQRHREVFHVRLQKDRHRLHVLRAGEMAAAACTRVDV